MTTHPVKEHKDLKRHLSSVDNLTNVLKDLNMLPDRSPNQSLPRINSFDEEYVDNDTYWNDDYADDDVMVEEPPSIKNKPLPAIPVPDNEYINMADNRTNSHFKFRV